MAEIVRDAMRDLFEELNVPVDHQASYIQKLTSALLDKGASLPGSWSSAIAAERRTPAGIELPETPPALWKHDRQLGDTPPDFIKRHYGPYLRQDGSGICRRDINRLDSALYFALSHWLSGGRNILPEDCPLPTKSESLDLQLAAVAPDRGEVSAREWARRNAAEWRRRKKIVNERGN